MSKELRSFALSMAEMLEASAHVYSAEITSGPRPDRFS